MREVVVLAEAVEDIEQARQFYDDQSLGVGDYCVDCLISDIESLILYHGIHLKRFGLHRMLSERFPFGIYYREMESRTEVVAVLDLRRDPAWLRQELMDRNC